MDTENDPDLFFEEDLFDDVIEPGVEDEISMILTDMNLAEKVGQMTQVALSLLSVPGREEIDPERLREAIVEHNVGSVFNVWSTALAPEEWHEIIATIQEVALLETRLGIPILYGIDSIHGANYTYGATLFPHNLGVAATWDPALAREIAAANARETAACGIPWVFAPILDLGRQPLWPRFIETFGEDVHLATTMARASAAGYAQMSETIAACGKHLIGCGAPKTGHDRTAAAIPEHELSDDFQPLRAAISEGLASIMVNSGLVNGDPIHTPVRLLTRFLREELGFDGIVVSDWEDVSKLHTVHGAALSEKEAVRVAVEAGIDMCRTPHSLSFATHLLALVEEGAISEDRIDKSVRRILRVKHGLGMFDHPFPDQDDIPNIGTDASFELSFQAAISSITLLKNRENILPLQDGARLLVTGPASDSVAALHGPWSYTLQGDDENAYPDDARTLVDDLSTRFGLQHVEHVKGIDWHGDVDVAAAFEAARRSDVAVLCLGESPSVEKPGDIDDLTLDAVQLEFARKMADAGKPIVLVLLQDRPRIIDAIEGLCDAILLAYRPGPEGGRAIAEILSGKENPGGRLPFTYPHPGLEAEYPFGFGLSYTLFEYSNLEILPPEVTQGGTVTVRVDVSNRGSRAGREVVQLYVTDEFASVLPQVRRLKGFQLVDLAPGETTTVSLQLPVESLGIAGLNGTRRLEPGRFRFETGGLKGVFEPA